MRFLDEGSCPHAIQVKVIATAAVATLAPYSNMPTPFKAIVVANSRYYDEVACATCVSVPGAVHIGVLLVMALTLA